MIPVTRPLLTGNEKKYLEDCIDSGWLSSDGPYVKKFEESVAAFTGRKYAVAVSNGSCALELALASLDLKPGDEVILPSLTIISCVNAVLRANATPVLVDCDALTYNIDVNQIKQKITPRTKAIMVVHLYGLPCDMDPILKLAEASGLKVIEDAAEMLGQAYHGKKCGSFGDVSILSFYANKIVTTGEGGMILTDDSGLAERLRSGRNLSFLSGKRFYHEELGWNYRMSNLQAAVGLAQMEQLDNFVLRKRSIGSLYNKLLLDLHDIQLPVERTDYAENIYWVYPVVIKDDNQDAETVMSRLGNNQISTRPFFWPLHEQPALIKQGLFKKESYPRSERLARKGFYLPSGLGTTEEEVISVVKSLRNFFE